MELSGFDELASTLDDLAKRADDLNGEHSISLEELLSPDFMKQHSTYLSVDEFFEAGGFDLESQDEFEKIPEDQLDGFVKKSTGFCFWDEMLEAAIEHYMVVKLGLGD